MFKSCLVRLLHITTLLYGGEATSKSKRDRYRKNINNQPDWDNIIIDNKIWKEILYNLEVKNPY